MNPRILAEKICTQLREHGFEAYFVGGCVRDLILGREPSDYDVATNALPGQVVGLFPGSLTVGAQFGVVIVSQEGCDVEVATFRSETTYSDGRHPDHVTFAQTPQADVQRRDFTINALLMDPRTAKILDFVDGRADIAAGIVRAISDPAKRFEEDRLRMIRAVRFAARFGYGIEDSTMTAIRQHAAGITTVSSERIRDECTRILTEGAARRGFELLDSVGLLQHVLPEVSRMKGVEQPPQFHPEGDVWIHTLLLLGMLPGGVSTTLAWGALLHDVGKPPTFAPPSGPEGRIRFDGHVEAGAIMAREICTRLHFSNEDTAQVVALVAQHLRFKDVQAMRQATLKRFVRQPGFSEHLELHRLDCLASHGNLENYEFIRRFLESTPAEAVRPPRLITGDDLKAMGLAPGPRFREILHEVEDAQLDGRLKTREEAIGFVKNIVG